MTLSREERRVECPLCGLRVVARVDGRLYSHGREGDGCLGSDETVEWARALSHVRDGRYDLLTPAELGRLVDAGLTCPWPVPEEVTRALAELLGRAGRAA